MDIEHKSRYPGALPFRDDPIDRKIFFGRDQETTHLFHMLLTEDLVVFYAKSGMGKTSLINAGLTDLLRLKGFCPLMCRVYAPGNTIDPTKKGHVDNLPLNDLLTTIEQSIKQNINNDFITEFEPGITDTLWEYFKTIELWRKDDKKGYLLLKPVLILDQFEELFTQYDSEDRIPFIKQLGDLIRGSIPSTVIKRKKLSKNTDQVSFPLYSDSPPVVKILITLRENALGYLAELSDHIPSIRRCEFRLTPMNRNNAQLAIEKPANIESDDFYTPPFIYEKNTLNEMLEFLSDPENENKDSIGKEIEPYQLQLLCHTIEKKVASKQSESHSGKIIVDQKITGGKEGMLNVIKHFYSDIINEIQKQNVRSCVLNLIENGLLSGLDRRLSLAKEQINSQFKVSDDILNDLVLKRLLRAEYRLNQNYYELSHDTLIKPIRKLQKEREKQEELEEISRRAFRYFIKQNKKVLICLGCLLLSLIIWQLGSIFGSEYFHNQGTKHLEAGESDEAIKMLNKSILFYKKHKNSHWLRANEYTNKIMDGKSLSDDEFDNALESYKYCIDHNYHISESYIGLINIFRYNKARLDKIFKDLFEQRDKLRDPLLFLSAGQLYVEIGNINAAKKLFSIAYNLVDSNDNIKEDVILAIANLKYPQNTERSADQYNELVNFLKNENVESSGFERAKEILSKAYFEQGNSILRESQAGANIEEDSVQHAIKVFQLSCRLKTPSSIDSCYFLGNLYYSSCQLSGNNSCKYLNNATFNYEHAIALSKKFSKEFDPKVFFRLGNVCFWEGEYDKAERYYNKTLELWPDDRDAQLGIAYCYKAEGDSEKSKEMFNKANLLIPWKKRN